MSKISRDTLWCVPFDRETISGPFELINLSKYLSRLFSKPHYPQFQLNMAQLCDLQENWKPNTYELLRLLSNLGSYLAETNEMFAFSHQSIQTKIDRIMLWVDLEKIYIFCFSNLGDYQFELGTDFMSIYRLLACFECFFMQLDRRDFEESFLTNLWTIIRNFLDQLDKSQDSELKNIIEAIELLFINFVQGKTYLKTPHHESLIKLVRKRVERRVASQKGIAGKIQKQIIKNTTKQPQNLNKITDMSFLERLTEETKDIYKPSLTSKITGVINSFREEQPTKLEQIALGTSPIKPKKGHILNLLNKNGHNPSLQKNKAVYGQGLNLPSQENRNKVVDQDKHGISVQKLEQMLANAQFCSAKVTQKDLKPLRKH